MSIVSAAFNYLILWNSLLQRWHVFG